MQNRGGEMHLAPPGKVFWTFLKHVLSDRYKIWQRANIVLSGPKSGFFLPNSFWGPRNPCPKFELFDLPLNYKGKVPKMIQNWLWRILNCQSCSRYLMVFSIRIGLVLIVFNCLAILTDLRILRIWSEYKQICQNAKPSYPTKIAWAWIRSLNRGSYFGDRIFRF